MKVHFLGHKHSFVENNTRIRALMSILFILLVLVVAYPILQIPFAGQEIKASIVSALEVDSRDLDSSIIEMIEDVADFIDGLIPKPPTS